MAAASVWSSVTGAGFALPRDADQRSAFQAVHVVRADGDESPAALRAAVPAGGRRSQPVVPRGLGGRRCLRTEDQFAHRGAAFEEAVGLGGLGEGEFPVDGEVELGARHGVEDFAGAPAEFVGGGGVVGEGGPGDEEGSVLGEEQGVDRGDRAGGLAVEDEHPARPDKAHALPLGRLPHEVAGGRLLHLRILRESPRRSPLGVVTPGPELLRTPNTLQGWSKVSPSRPSRSTSLPRLTR